MHLPKTRTAVLLFSLPAHLDASRKRLAGRGTTRNLAFWQTMQQLTVAKVEAAGLPCLESTKLVPTLDYSLSFGEQLQAAISAALGRGFEQLIVIGNDCADLRVSDLLVAADTINHGLLPVGYDKRGGVFLFGIDARFQKADCAAQFTNLPWQTAPLGTALTDLLHHSFGKVTGLSATRTDWNRKVDVQAGSWLSGAFVWLTGRLWSLVARVLAALNDPIFSVNSILGRIQTLRAPPATC